MCTMYTVLLRKLTVNQRSLPERCLVGMSGEVNVWLKGNSRLPPGFFPMGNK